MNFDGAALSESGPRALNEDVAEFWVVNETTVAAVVADGLGGMGGGSDASAIAVETLRYAIYRDEMTELNLRDAAFLAHNRIIRKQKERPEISRMATTLTAILCHNRTMIGVHCGDTRASVSRGKGIIRLTSDHSEKERLLRAGKLSKSEAAEYSRNNVLESALGIHREVKIDTFSFDLHPGDRVFLTTDGVHERVLLREMRNISERHTSAAAFVHEMADLVIARAPRDNYSLACVFAS